MLIDGEIGFLTETRLTPTADTNGRLKAHHMLEINKSISLKELLRRPEVRIADIYTLMEA